MDTSAEPRSGKRRKAVDSLLPEPERGKQRGDDTKLDMAMRAMFAVGPYSLHSRGAMVSALAVLCPDAGIPQPIGELLRDSTELNQLLESAWKQRTYGALLKFCRNNKLEFPCSPSIHSS